MSEMKFCLEVSPPKHGQHKENTVSRGHECPQCNGSGKVYRGDVHCATLTTCPQCGGSGRLAAHIVIEWIPEK